MDGKSEDYLDSLLKSISDNEQSYEDTYDSSSDLEEKDNIMNMDSTGISDNNDYTYETDYSDITYDDEAPESLEDSQSYEENDIDVLGKIFDNFSDSYEKEQGYSSDDAIDDYDDIEMLIQKGNEYTKQLNNKTVEDDISLSNSYDENGNYILNNDEFNNIELDNDESFRLDNIESAMLQDEESYTLDDFNNTDSVSGDTNNDSMYDVIDNGSDEDLLALLNEISSSGDDSDSYDNTEYDTTSHDTSYNDYINTDSDNIDNDNINTDTDNVDTDNLNADSNNNDNADLDELLASLDSDIDTGEDMINAFSAEEPESLIESDNLDNSDESYFEFEDDVQTDSFVEADKELSTDINTDSKKSTSDDNPDLIDIDEIDKIISENNNSDEAYQTADGTVFMPKSKKSLFKRLFGNVEIPQDGNNKEEEEEDEELLAQKKEEELQKKKEEEEQKKLQKEEKKRLKAEEKEQKKKLKESKKQQQLEEEKNQPRTRINKIGATLIFIIFGVLAVVIVLFNNKFSYSLSINNCEKYYDQGQYDLAYEQINKLNLKDEDGHLYEELRTIMYVYTYVCDEKNFREIEEYNKALNSLLTSLQRYNQNKENADELGISDKYDKLHKDIKTCLKEEYGLSEKKAEKILNISDDYKYSEEIDKIVTKLYDNSND